jgi:O-antigen/teichoic acid export membrane protein
LIVVAGLLLLPLSAPFRIVLESDQRGYRVNNLLVVQSLATTALSLGFAYYGGGIAGQALAVLIASLPYHLRLLTYGRRRFPRVMRAAAAATPADAATARARLLSLNRPTFVLNLCGRVGLLSDNIVVAALLGPAAVVPFFATQRIAVMVQGQLQSLGNATWAGLAQLHAAGERELFNRRLVDLTGLVAALGVATLIPVIAFNEAFVTRWLGAQRFGGQALTLVAVLNAFLLSISSLWGWALNGTGRVEQIVRPFGIQTVVNLVMSIALTKALGLIGPMLGTTLGYLSVSIWYFPVLMHRAFGVSGGELRRAIAKPVLLGTPFGIATWMLARMYAPTGWLMLLAEMMLATACYLCAWWLVLLPKSERHLYTKRVAGVLRYQSA